MANVAEHLVQMPVAPSAAVKAAAALPEKRLNLFVHVVAAMERLGNALGTLAFTWATVVLLGGYPTVLRPKRDFLFVTIIIFLEALRMFSGNNKLDYQLFFRTRGAFRSLGSNGLIWFACISNVIVCMMASTGIPPIFGVILVTGPFMCLRPARLLIPNPLRSAVSLWSPMVAVLLLYPPIHYSLDEDGNTHKHSFITSVTMRTVYLILFVSVLLLTISRLQFPSIIKLVDWAFGRKLVFWRPVILNMSMVAAIVMLLFTFHGIVKVYYFTLDILVLMTVSFGNLQIPAAVLRIVLAAWGIDKAKDHYSVHDDNANLGENTNLVSSLYVFYAMVAGQGILYIIAIILEIFSFILRRSLIRNAGFRGPLGVEYVNLYYEEALEKCMKGNVLAPEKISLITFAMDSLKSDSPKKQLYGIKMLYNFLEKEPLKTKAISELTTCMNTMTCLINMLERTSEGDKDIRSFAAEVTAEVADNLRIVLIPGAMQAIASLLDTPRRQKLKNHLLDIGSPEAKHGNLIEQVVRDEQTSPMLWLKRMAMYCLLPREEPTNINEQKSHILGCWEQITKCWSIPEEEPSTDHDLLPVQGMLILDRLASFHLENCIEISRATGLISMVIGFTSNIPYMQNINETHRTMLKGSSLKLLRRLASTEGKIGVTLRQKISEHPFLLSNLAEILNDNGSRSELRELTAGLLRNLAMEGNIREEIRHIPVIISRLIHALLNQGAPSTTLLQMISGQALVVLAMDNANNCLAMLAETRDLFIKELTVMIHDDRRYIASSLLRNICVHARSKFGNSNLKDISSILREVLEGIMDAEGEELEILIGLSSQICIVIPEVFARELEHGQIKGRFIMRLVNVLNSNRIPAAHCPGIRRVVVEQVIYMIDCNPSYAKCFVKYKMMEELLRVERTLSRAENYRFFSGDAGLMEHNIPLSALVSRAKELMSREYL